MQNIWLIVGFLCFKEQRSSRQFWRSKPPSTWTRRGSTCRGSRLWTTWTSSTWCSTAVKCTAPCRCTSSSSCVHHSSSDVPDLLLNLWTSYVCRIIWGSRLLNCSPTTRRSRTTGAKFQTNTWTSEYRAEPRDQPMAVRTGSLLWNQKSTSGWWLFYFLHGFYGFSINFQNPWCVCEQQIRWFFNCFRFKLDTVAGWPDGLFGFCVINKSAF